MDINELKPIITFIKAAELGAIRKAAAAQGMTPQAASKSISQLEKQIGVRLFHRTTRQLSLTAEGQQFYNSMKPALTNFETALRQAQQSREVNAGPLRIIGPRTSFRPVIAKILNRYHKQYPLIQPEIILDDNIGNWVEDRADIGFRLGLSPSEGVIARRLLPLQLILCAAPSYLQQFGAPKSIDDLQNHRCSVYRHPKTEQTIGWNLRVGDSIKSIQVNPSMSFNDEDLETDAILNGAVIGLMSGITAAEHVRAGRLVPILTQHSSDQMGIYIYYGSRVSQPARVRAFIDTAVGCCSDPADFVLSKEELSKFESQGLSLVGE